MSPYEGCHSQVLRALFLPMPSQVFSWFKRLGEAHLIRTTWPSPKLTVSVKEMQGLAEARVKLSRVGKEMGADRTTLPPRPAQSGNEQMAGRAGIQA